MTQKSLLKNNVNTAIRLNFLRTFILRVVWKHLWVSFILIVQELGNTKNVNSTGQKTANLLFVAVKIILFFFYIFEPPPVSKL